MSWIKLVQAWKLYTAITQEFVVGKMRKTFGYFVLNVEGVFNKVVWQNEDLFDSFNSLR